MPSSDNGAYAPGGMEWSDAYDADAEQKRQEATNTCEYCRTGKACARCIPCQIIGPCDLVRFIDLADPPCSAGWPIRDSRSFILLDCPNCGKSPCPHPRECSDEWHYGSLDDDPVVSR